MVLAVLGIKYLVKGRRVEKHHSVQCVACYLYMIADLSHASLGLHCILQSVVKVLEFQ